MLMHDLEVLCNEPWCCILCWQVDMQFSYATHLAHPVLCSSTHLNISDYASGVCVCVCVCVCVREREREMKCHTNIEVKKYWSKKKQTQKIQNNTMFVLIHKLLSMKLESKRKEPNIQTCLKYN